MAFLGIYFLRFLTQIRGLLNLQAACYHEELQERTLFSDPQSTRVHQHHPTSRGGSL